MGVIATGRRRALAVPAGGGTVPLVSNITLAHSVGSGLVNCSIIFHDDRVGVGSDDGRILTKRHNTVYTDMGDDDNGSPVDHTGEWTSDAVTESEWEVAMVSLTSGSWDFEYAALGVYTTLDTVDMQWRLNRTGGKGYTPGTNSVFCTFRIREVADTANGDNFNVIATATQT